MPTLRGPLFALTFVALVAPAHAEEPAPAPPRGQLDTLEPGCLRDDPAAFDPKRTELVDHRLLLGRSVAWVKGLGADESLTFDLERGALFSGRHRPNVPAPQAVEPEPPPAPRPIVTRKQNGWTLDWVATRRPVVNEMAARWELSEDRALLYLLTDGVGRTKLHVYDTRTRRRVGLIEGAEYLSFERLPGAPYLVIMPHKDGRNYFADALGKRTAEVGTGPSYDLTRFDRPGFRGAPVTLDGYAPGELWRLVHPKCDEVLVQSAKTGSLVRRVDLTPLRPDPARADGTGCLTYPYRGQLLVLPGQGAASQIALVDPAAGLVTKTWTLPRCPTP